MCNVCAQASAAAPPRADGINHMHALHRTLHAANKRVRGEVPPPRFRSPRSPRRVGKVMPRKSNGRPLNGVQFGGVWRTRVYVLSLLLCVGPIPTTMRDCVCLKGGGHAECYTWRARRPVKTIRLFVECDVNINHTLFARFVCDWNRSEMGKRNVLFYPAIPI